MERNEDITITLAGEDRLDEVEPSWLAMRDHHVPIDVRGVPPRPGSEGWGRRRTQYARWLREGNGFLVLADVVIPHPAERKAVGFAMVSIDGEPPTMWDVAPPAVLQTLSVLPEWRGRGIGTRLMEAVHAELHRRGVAHMVISVLAANDGAMSFYRRLGYRTASFQLWGDVPTE